MQDMEGTGTAEKMKKRDGDEGTKKQDPVGIFDSGVGGISVVREIVRILPSENLYVFGDSQNAPYGSRTLEEVRSLTLSHVETMICEKSVKAVVVACNTATSAAIASLRERYQEIPMIGIEPALKPAAMLKHHGKVLVLATEMTIREEKYHELAKRFSDQAELIPLPAPQIVTLVEEGKQDSKEMDAYLADLFEPYRRYGIDAVVLGCTHFPFARNAIRRYWGERVRIFDGAEGTARELKRRLTENDLRNPSEGRGKIVLENSGGREKIRLSERLLGL